MYVVAPEPSFTEKVGRQHMYKVALRRFRLNVVSVEKQALNVMSVSLYSNLIYPHENRIFSASYYISTCGLSGSTVFCHTIS